MGTLLDGKKVSAGLREEIAMKVSRLKNEGIIPCLAVVLVGEDPASQKYVSNKARACEEVGIRSIVKELPSTASQEEILRTIKELNADETINGILVQLPLPAHIDVDQVIRAINPGKDIDGLGEQSKHSPCTPLGIIILANAYGISLLEKKIVVCGRGRTAGRPMPRVLMEEGVLEENIRVIHSQTEKSEIPGILRGTDIIISCVGKEGFKIQTDWINHGAVVVDAGGDIEDFESAMKKVSFITPASGGVGPMTIAMLLENTVEAASM